MVRRPFVSITGPSGGNLVTRLGDRLISATIVDQAGGESDTLTFVVSISHPFPPGPPVGTRYSAAIGWSETGARHAGIYTVQSSAIGGDAGSGHTMTVTCRAADYLDTMKTVDSEHFDDQTVGAIFQQLAGRAGVSAVIDPELATIKLPYRLRWKQPPIDFLDDIAAEIGGTMKPAAERILLLKRGAKRSASGAPFPPIAVPFRDDFGFDVASESRGEFQELGGDWFDPVEGLLKSELASGIGRASRYLPVHLLPTQDEAKRAAESIGREHARKSVTGFFSMAGNPHATAEAPVVPQGYGGEIDSLDIVCACATHEVTFGENGGWITTVDIESAASAAGGRKGGGGGSSGDYVPSWDVPAGGPNAGG